MRPAICTLSDINFRERDMGTNDRNLNKCLQCNDDEVYYHGYCIPNGDKIEPVMFKDLSVYKNCALIAQGREKWEFENEDTDQYFKYYQHLEEYSFTFCTYAIKTYTWQQAGSLGERPMACPSEDYLKRSKILYEKLTRDLINPCYDPEGVPQDWREILCYPVIEECAQKTYNKCHGQSASSTSDAIECIEDFETRLFATQSQFSDLENSNRRPPCKKINNPQGSG